MTALPDRPNTALLVIDVQNGVLAGAHNRDDVIATIDAPRRQGPRRGRAGRLGAALERPVAARQRQLATRAGTGAHRVGAARPQDVRRLVRGHRPGDAAGRARRRPARRRGRPDRRVHPLDDPRRLRPRLRRDARRRRAHDRGSDRVRRPAARAGDRAHEPVLAVGERARPPWRDARVGRRQLQPQGPPQTLAPSRFRAPSPGRTAASARDRWRPPPAWRGLP